MIYLRLYTGLLLIVTLMGCKSSWNNTSNLQPIATHAMPGVEDFDIHRYQIGQEELTDQLYFFGFDRSDLSAEDTEALQHIADIMIKNPKITARIEGHTDDLGSSEYNIALAWRRAQTVARYLESQGVAAQRIESHS